MSIIIHSIIFIYFLIIVVEKRSVDYSYVLGVDNHMKVIVPFLFTCRAVKHVEVKKKKFY